MKSNILKIFYGLLIIALGISVFCASVILKNGKSAKSVSYNSQTPSEEKLDTELVENNVQALEFDSNLRGTGNLECKNMNIGGVPCILYYRDDYEIRPIIIVQHGLTSKKEDMKDLANAFAQQGYLVVTPDAAAHGELENNDKWSLTELIQETSKDFDTILDYFAKSNYIDMNRIGIAGISLGGLSTFYYVKNGNYDPKVVVSMCSTPKYEDIAGTSAAYNYYKKGKLVAENKESERKNLDESLFLESPYEDIVADEHTYYYLLCGDQDDVVPYQGNVELYEAKKDTTVDMILQVKEGQGHTVTEEDLWEILSYVVAHL